MMWLFAAVITATLAVHLGLFDAVMSILERIAKCQMCATFWLGLVFAWVSGEDVIAAVTLSIIAAYLSNWLALVMVWLNRKYTELWEKLSSYRLK